MFTHNHAGRVRLGGRTVSAASAAILAALCSLAGGTAAAAGERDSAKKNRRRLGRNAVAWHSLDEGLEKVRAEYRPFLVHFEPESPAEKKGNPAAKKQRRLGPKRLDGLLSRSSVKRVARPFVQIRLTPSDLDTTYPGMEPPPDDRKKPSRKNGHDGEKAESPKEEGRRPLVPGVEPEKRGERDSQKETGPAKKGAPGPPAAAAGTESRVGARFALRGDQPALLVLDFRERVVLRYDGEVPRASRLKSQLSRIAKVNAFYAREARRVEKILEKSLYAFGAGDTRAAILEVRELEQKKARAKMDPVLKEQVNSVIARFRKKARAQTAAANQLDRGKKYQAALLAFERIMREFPFVDVQKYAAKRKGEIWRKLTFGG